ncbi:MAG: hypothetical protein ACLTAI_01530 [Thomasclavelia sp.]
MFLNRLKEIDSKTHRFAISRLVFVATASTSKIKKYFFDDKEIPLHRLVKRKRWLSGMQEKYGGYGTNEDECGFTYGVDIE